MRRAGSDPGHPVLERQCLEPAPDPHAAGTPSGALALDCRHRAGILERWELAAGTRRAPARPAGDRRRNEAIIAPGRPVPLGDPGGAPAAWHTGSRDWPVRGSTLAQ